MSVCYSPPIKGSKLAWLSDCVDGSSIAAASSEGCVVAEEAEKKRRQQRRLKRKEGSTVAEEAGKKRRQHGVAGGSPNRLLRIDAYKTIPELQQVPY